MPAVGSPVIRFVKSTSKPPTDARPVNESSEWTAPVTVTVDPPGTYIPRSMTRDTDILPLVNKVPNTDTV